MRGFLLLLLMLALPAAGFAATGAEGGAPHIQKLDQAAPDFLLHDASGARVRLADLCGRPVILHFWATWCASCRRELPAIDAYLRSRANGDAVILMISIDRDATPDQVRAYAEGLGVSSPVYGIADAEISDRYWTWGVPATYFIDRDGKLTGRVLGPLDWDSAETVAAIEGLATP